ncbi:MAG: hypothetical protein AB7D37_03820 [Desulfovibrio sp.]
MNIKKVRPRFCQESRGAKAKAWGVNTPSLSTLRKSVNRIHVVGLLFGRDLLLNGLAGLGWPWSRRLSLWVDWLDQRAEELRERQGARA